MNKEPTSVYLEELPESLVYKVEEGESLLLQLFPKTPWKKSKIEVHVSKNGTFEGTFADVISHSGDFSLDVYLEGEGATSTWDFASLSVGTNKKKFVPSVYHRAPYTVSRMSSHGIASGSSTLSFSGVSEIIKGAIKTSARQEAKIIVFDGESDGKSSPVLKIGDNDVEASHAAVVGRLSDEHLYYLESRGIPRSEARKLIALGYIVPVISKFPESVRPEMDKRIQEALFDD